MCQGRKRKDSALFLRGLRAAGLLRMSKHFRLCQNANAHHCHFRSGTAVRIQWGVNMYVFTYFITILLYTLQCIY